MRREGRSGARAHKISLWRLWFRVFFQQPETAAVQPGEDGESQGGARKVMRKKVMRLGEEKREGKGWGERGEQRGAWEPGTYRWNSP